MSLKHTAEQIKELTKETEYGDGSKVDSNTESAKLLNDGDKLCAFISTMEQSM